MNQGAVEPGVLSDGRLAALLLLSFIAAIVVLVGVLPEVAALALNLIVAGIAVVTAPERKRQGGGWWTVLALGAAAALLGEGLSHFAETPGSILALVGGVAVAASSVIGFPVAD